jgi:hypothetical protein
MFLLLAVVVALVLEILAVVAAQENLLFLKVLSLSQLVLP